MDPKDWKIQLSNYCQNNSSDCQRIPQGLKPAGFQQGTNDYKNIPHSQSFVQYIWDLLNYPPTDLTTAPFTLLGFAHLLLDLKTFMTRRGECWKQPQLRFANALLARPGWTTKRRNKLCPYELLLQACTLFENCWNEPVLKFSLFWFGISRFFLACDAKTWQSMSRYYTHFEVKNSNFKH